MYYSFVLALLFGASASAFVAPRHASTKMTTLQVTPVTLNGWTPKKNEFAWGLPGRVAPFQDGFDPLNFAEDLTLGEMKRYREAEVTHGRVAMLATLGFLVAEKFHPLFGLEGVELLAIDALTLVRKVLPYFFEVLVITISTVELYRAVLGWAKPKYSTGVAPGDMLLEDYYPGDIGFDPFGLKPTDAEEFETMQTKELNHGRLAMFAIAGLVAQELIDHKPILNQVFSPNYGAP